MGMGSNNEAEQTLNEAIYFAPEGNNFEDPHLALRMLHKNNWGLLKLHRHPFAGIASRAVDTMVGTLQIYAARRIVFQLLSFHVQPRVLRDSM